MPYLVRENLFIGNTGAAADFLQHGSGEITHILSVLSSTSISFFSEWRREIRKVYVYVGGSGTEDDSGDGSKSSLAPEKVLYSLEKAGKDLKFARMAVPLRDTESEDLLDYLDVCLDFIDRSGQEGSVLVHCFAGVSRRYKLANPSNNSSILDPVVENNYQLFMVERLIMMEDDNDLSLTDDPKKSTRTWQIPVYTMDTRD